MKRILMSLLAATLLFSSCEDLSQHQQENEELKKELEGYKDAEVQDIVIEGDSMTILFSNGVEYTATTPESLQGTEGEDGVGIENIEFDQESGNLTITMTDGKVYTFQLTSDEGVNTAVLISDTNGKYLLSKMTLGDVPVVEITYTDDYQMESVTNYITNGFEVLKTGIVEKQYDSEGNLTGIHGKTYAVTESWDYSTEYIYNDYASYNAPLNGYDDHYELNDDGITYTYYELADYYEGNYDSTYNYYVYHYAAFRYDQNEWEFTKSIGGDTYVLFENAHTREYLESNASYRYWYFGERKFVVYGKHEIGDLTGESTTLVDATANGMIETVYDAATEADAFEKMVNTYNSDELITKTDIQRKSNGSWVSDGSITYQYNTNDLMETATFTNSDTSFVVQKFVYDENNNPVEIWLYMDETELELLDGSFDPTTGEYIASATREAGLYQLADVEYKANMKNFLGHTWSALMPEFKGLKLNNAPARIIGTNTYLYGGVEYKHFNEGGYPETITGYSAGGARIEFMMDYVKIEE